MSYQLRWFDSFLLLLKWQALRLRPMLPLLALIQLLIGVGVVIGMGFMVPDINPATAKFLVTGGPTLTLIGMGLSFMPQQLAQFKAQGSYEYMWSLPVPRMAFLAAEMTVWLLVALPGLVLALLVGSLRYDFTLQVSPLAVPAFLLVALMATSVGYALVHISPKQELVLAITNFVTFCLFLFSPINFPVERLPHWLANLHHFLPVKYAADAVRGTLTEGHAGDLGLAFTVLGAWCLAGFGITYLVLTRKR